MIVNCSFEDSVGTALGVLYSSLHLHGNSFTSNCNGHSSRSLFGGGITAKNSTLKFTGNTAFRYNSVVEESMPIIAL